MAKRLIDDEIFENEWFMGLPKDSKLLYIYLFTKCNHAGLINLNFKLCEFQTGISNVESELTNLQDKVIKVEGEKNLYFLRKYFERQYPNYPNGFRASKSAVEILMKYDLWDEKNERVKVNGQSTTDNSEPLSEPLSEPKEPEKINHLLEAVDTWNFFADAYNLPKVLKLTNTRKAHIRQRLKEKEFNLEQILRKVEKSQFLLGQKSDWKISFDFIFGSKNKYIEILEGKYDGRNEQSNRQSELKELLLDIDSDPTLESKHQS